MVFEFSIDPGKATLVAMSQYLDSKFEALEWRNIYENSLKNMVETPLTDFVEFR